VTTLRLPGGATLALDVPVVPQAAWGSTYDYAGRHEAKSAPVYKHSTRLHCTVTIAPDLLPPYDDETKAMRTLERIGVERFGSGVSYAFVIMPTGRIYEGMPANTKQTQSGHNVTANYLEYGVAFCGDYEADPAPEPMLRAASRLQAALLEAKLITVAGFSWHAQVAAKACPGRYVISRVPDMERWARSGPQEEDDTTPPKPVRKVYLSRLRYGVRDSDSVRHLQRRLNGVKLRGGRDLPVTGNFLDLTLAEVRKWQKQIPNDPPDGKLGPKQARLLFGSGYDIVNDL